MGNIGMCGPKGNGFPAVLVINRVSILVDLGHFGHNRVWFLQQKPLTNYVYGNLKLV